MAEAIKKLTRRDILNNFHNQWLERKLAAEVDLEFIGGSSILLTNPVNPSEDLAKQIKKKEVLKEIMNNADKYLEIFEDKLKEEK